MITLVQFPRLTLYPFPLLPFTPVPWPTCSQVGWQIAGEEVGSAETDMDATVEDCSLKCSRHATCAFWSHKKANDKCTLKGREDGRKAESAHCIVDYVISDVIGRLLFKCKLPFCLHITIYSKFKWKSKFVGSYLVHGWLQAQIPMPVIVIIPAHSILTPGNPVFSLSSQTGNTSVSADAGYTIGPKNCVGKGEEEDESNPSPAWPFGPLLANNKT